ncbi:MAG TPA: regulatory protein RecX [Armatimonadota bacterium]
MTIEHDIAETPDDDRAMQYALRVLGYRQRSEAEMRQRLARKGFAAQVADRILARLTHLQLLDDREFARSWVASRVGYGPARLKQELRQKGIDRDLAEEMILTGISADEEVTLAQQVADRVLRQRSHPPDAATLLRLRRLLQRRGFSYEVIGRVCARLQNHLTAEGDWLE